MKLETVTAEGLPARKRSGSKTKTRPGRERRFTRKALRQVVRRQRRVSMAVAHVASEGA